MMDHDVTVHTVFPSP